MKKLLFTAMLWAGIFMPIMNAQSSTKVDTLNILVQDETLIKVLAPRIQKLRGTETCTQLIVDFKTHLEMVKEKSPAYPIFKITYYKDVSLKVEEVEGVVKYQIENGVTIPSFNQNTAELHHGKIKIILYFNQIDELLEQNYEVMIQDAFSKMKKEPNFLKRTYFPIDEYFYSYSQGKMVKGYIKPKYRNRFGLVFNATVGIFKNNAIYEIDYGVGYVFGKNNRRMVSLFGGTLFQYNEELQKHDRLNIIGIGFTTPSKNTVFRFSTVTDGLVLAKYGDFTYRLSGTFYPIRGLSVTLHNHFNNQFEGYFPGVSFGFGL